MAQATQSIALTIAGSDSGGGAGVQADLKTFAAFGCFGTSVITAVTAQNTLGVHAIHSIPVDIIDAQLQALANDLPPAACKTGMLTSAEVISVVATAIRANGWAHYVCDPVMIASSGDVLVDDDALMALRHYLLPLAACVTPNLDEAEALTGLTVRDPEAMVRAGQALLALGARAALVKGGHLASDILVDVLVTADRIERFTRSRVATRATHGTGCTLSAAITAQLAREAPIVDAVRKGIEHVQRGIRNAPHLGAGNGPLG
ncbi:MAG TPA: bifunctional hydroxymethylpyrimidine kinase/phosphomethylpyrimidine kinase [Gemmatimonadales bacterium]|jgi:hydroxymethylpyrimidine/phosphomethylpyrimidine kinase